MKHPLAYIGVLLITALIAPQTVFAIGASSVSGNASLAAEKDFPVVELRDGTSDKAESPALTLPVPASSSEPIPKGDVSARIESLGFKKRAGATRNLFGSGILPMSVIPTGSSSEFDGLPNVLARGLNFIGTHQMPDGAWRTGQNQGMSETGSILRLLHSLNLASSTSYALGNIWLSVAFPENTDYVAEKVWTLAEDGEDVEFLDDYLAAQINERDHGFGFQKRFGSDPVTTAKVLRAITASNYSDSGEDAVFTLKSILIYLSRARNGDGGWPETPGGVSSVFATTQVLDALLPYKNIVIVGPAGGDIPVSDMIVAGLEYLLANQSSDGSWEGNALTTARAYDALLAYGVYPYRNTEALNYLLNTQAADGSFGNGDVYATAEAIRTLAKPDLAVLDIKNISELIPNEEAVAEITIGNIGFWKTDPIPFALKPSAFSLFIDGKEANLDFTGAPSTLTFEAGGVLLLRITLKNLPFGPHTVTFKVDYQGAEFSEENNETSANLVFDDPGFSGPTPPLWIGASTGSSRGEVRVRWKLSGDPETARYAVFLRTAGKSYSPFSPVYISNNASEIGVNFSLGSGLWGAPLYFTVAALDANYIRGDYSKETFGVGYENPDNFTGDLSGHVTEEDGSPVSLASVSFYTFSGALQTLADGSFNVQNVYPGFYYATAARAGYVSASQEIQIKTGEEAVYDFKLKVIDDGLAPLPVSGFMSESGDKRIILRWNPYENQAGDFKRFNVYRSSQPIMEDALPPTSIRQISDPSAVEFTDTAVVNGFTYHYAITVSDTAGNESDAVGVGPARGNSAPIVDDVSASQNGLEVRVIYDLHDAEDDKVQVKLLYTTTTGGTWLPARDAVGIGEQQIGEGRAMIWNPMSNLPDFDGMLKVRVSADDASGPNGTAHADSGEFALDTKKPAAPILNATPSLTNNSILVFSGEKETETALRINGVEVLPLSPDTRWSRQVALSEGENTFEFSATDEFGNESDPVSAFITLDTAPPPPMSDIQTTVYGNVIVFRWQAYTSSGNMGNDDISAIEIYRKETPIEDINGMSPLERLGKDAVSYRDTEVTRGARYFYALVARDEAGNPSVPSFVATDMPAPFVASLVNPLMKRGNLTLVSFEDENEITGLNGKRYTLGKNELRYLPFRDVYSPTSSSTVFHAQKPFTVASTQSGTEPAVPHSYEGTRFVFPLLNMPREFFLYAPYADAEVRFEEPGKTAEVVNIPKGKTAHYRYPASGGAMSRAVSLSASEPVLVFEQGMKGKNRRETVNVYPALTGTLYGIATRNYAISALENETEVTIEASNGKTASFKLKAGEALINPIRSSGPQGVLEALGIRITASKPISAYQYDDGDGNEMTAFLPETELIKETVLPTSAQYVAVLGQGDTRVELVDPKGKAIIGARRGTSTLTRFFFGKTARGPWIPEGTKIIASAPIYVIYEDSLTEGERNLYGAGE